MGCKILYKGKEYEQDDFIGMMKEGNVPVTDDVKARFQIARLMEKFHLTHVNKDFLDGYVSSVNKTVNASFFSKLKAWVEQNPFYSNIIPYYNTSYGVIQFLSKNTSKWVDDIGGDFREIPFKLAGRKGQRTLVASPHEYDPGTYSDSAAGLLYNVVSQGKSLLKDYLQAVGMTKRDFIKNYVTKDEMKQDYMKDFLADKKELFVHTVDVVKSADDVMPDMDDPRFAKIFDNRQKILNKLKKELLKEKDKIKKETIRERIRVVQEQIDALRTDESRTFSTILAFMKSDMDAVEHILDSTPDRRSMEYATSLLYNYNNLLSVDFRDTIRSLDDTTRLDVLSFKSRADDLSDRLIKQFLAIPADMVKRMTGQNIMIDGLPIHAKDIDDVAKYLKDTTENPNPIVQTLTKVIKSAITRLNHKYQSFKTEHKGLVDEVVKFQKSAGLKKDMYYDYMTQVDHAGKRTGNFVGRLSYDYIKAKNEAIGKDKLLFYAQNHTVKINKAAWNEREKSLIEWYKANKADNAVLTDSDIKSGRTFEDKLEQQAQAFADTKNPYTMQSILEKAKQNPKALTKYDLDFFKSFEKYGGFYAEKVGDEYIRPLELIADDKWEDKKYKAIQAMSDSDPRKQFYNHFAKKYEEGRRSLSDEEAYLPWNYIPEKTKDLGVGGNLRQWWTDSISQMVSQNIHGLDPVTGEIIKAIPVYMVGGQISAENKSYDLGNVLDSFMREVINHDEKSEIEDDANLLLSLLRKQKTYETNPDGTIKEVGGEPRYKDVSNNFLMAQYRLNANLYDERQDKEVVTSLKKRDELVNRKLKEIKQKIDEIPLTPDEKDEALQFVHARAPYTGNNDKIQQYVDLAKEYQETRGQFKLVTGNKITNFMLFFTSIKLLGLNLFGGVAEYLQGTCSLFTESAGGRYFTDKNALKAYGRVMRSMFNPWDSEEKSFIRNLGKYFGTNAQAFQDDNQNNWLSKAAFAQWEFANRVMNGAFLLAMLDHETITDKNGNVHSVGDVLRVDDSGRFSWTNPNIDQELHDAKGNMSQYLIDFQHKYKEVLKDNRERQAFEDPILMEKTMLGRIFGQFKKNWLFRAFYSRFGDYREADQFRGKDSKGFYRSFIDLFKLPKVIDDFGEEVLDTSAAGFATMFGRVLKSFVQFSTVGRSLGLGPKDGEFSEVDAVNLRKFMREFLSVLTLSTAIIVLSSGGDGPDKDKARTYFVNQLIRLQRDLATYMNPNSFASILKNPAPVVSTMSDFFSIGSAMIQTGVLFDPYTHQKGHESLRILNAIQKNVPFVNQIDRMSNKVNKTLTYSGY